MNELNNRQFVVRRDIHIIACPGLGTATGQVPYPEAARQMSIAYRNFLHPPSSINWEFAQSRQAEIRFGGDMGLVILPES